MESLGEAGGGVYVWKDIWELSGNNKEGFKAERETIAYYGLSTIIAIKVK